MQRLGAACSATGRCPVAVGRSSHGQLSYHASRQKRCLAQIRPRCCIGRPGGSISAYNAKTNPARARRRAADLAPFLMKSATRTLALLATAVSLTLSGCSSSPNREKAPVPVLPPVSAPVPVLPPVSAATWRSVDEGIWAMSGLAASESEAYAMDAMGEWMTKVRQRTEEVFVPWYLDYWTQRWISAKVAWYRLSVEENGPQATEQLAAYLQGEYQARVLEPVTKEVDPRAIRNYAARMYAQLMSEKLDELAMLYQIPPEMFRKRLEEIPAIVIPGNPEQDASLADIVHGGPISTNPAYVALIREIEADGEDVGSGDRPDELHAVAKIAADKLAGTIAVQGGAAAAAAIFGGPAGALISFGSLGWGVYEHERNKPELEVQLRDSLDSALKEIWRHLAEDPRTGVTAPIRQISVRIEQSVSVPYLEPAQDIPAI